MDDGAASRFVIPHWSPSLHREGTRESEKGVSLRDMLSRLPLG